MLNLVCHYLSLRLSDAGRHIISHQRSGFVRVWRPYWRKMYVKPICVVRARLGLALGARECVQDCKEKMEHVVFIILLPYVFVCKSMYSYITCILPNVSVCTCMLSYLYLVVRYSFAEYLLVVVCCLCVLLWCFSNDRLSLALIQSCTIKK